MLMGTFPYTHDFWPLSTGVLAAKIPNGHITMQILLGTWTCAERPTGECNYCLCVCVCLVCFMHIFGCLLNLAPWRFSKYSSCMTTRSQALALAEH